MADKPEDSAAPEPETDPAALTGFPGQALADVTYEGNTTELEFPGAGNFDPDDLDEIAAELAETAQAPPAIAEEEPMLGFPGATGNEYVGLGEGVPRSYPGATEMPQDEPEASDEEGGIFFPGGIALTVEEEEPELEETASAPEPAARPVFPGGLALTVNEAAPELEVLPEPEEESDGNFFPGGIAMTVAEEPEAEDNQPAYDEPSFPGGFSTSVEPAAEYDEDAVPEEEVEEEFDFELKGLPKIPGTGYAAEAFPGANYDLSPADANGADQVDDLNVVFPGAQGTTPEVFPGAASSEAEEVPLRFPGSLSQPESDQ